MYLQMLCNCICSACKQFDGPAWMALYTDLRTADLIAIIASGFVVLVFRSSGASCL